MFLYHVDTLGVVFTRQTAALINVDLTVCSLEPVSALTDKPLLFVCTMSIVKTRVTVAFIYVLLAQPALRSNKHYQAITSIKITAANQPLPYLKL